MNAETPRQAPTPLALSALGFAFGAMALDSLLVAAAGPLLAGELRGFELLSWLLTAYLVTWTVTGPLWGRLADMYGRRPILLIGLGFYVAGAFLAAAAQSMEQVIACRLVQGIGIGAVQPVAYTAGGELFPPSERAKGQALFSAVYLVASVFSPLVTQVLIVGISWRMLFVVLGAVGVVGGVFLWLGLQESVERRPHQIDWGGALALAVGAGSLMLALAQGTRGGGWTTPSQLTLYVLSGLGVAAFLWLEARAREPIMPLSLYRNRIFLGSCVVLLASGACLWSYNAFIPLLVQGVLGDSPVQASLLGPPINGAWLATNVLAVPLLWRWGYRVTCLVGMATLAVGFALFTLVSHDGWGFGMVVVGVIVIGLGLGFVNTAPIVAVQNAVPWSERATATSGLQFYRQFGPAVVINSLQLLLNADLAGRLAGIGIALEGLPVATTGRAGQANALLAPELRERLDPATLEAMRTALELSLHQTYWVIVVVALLGCVAVWLLPGGHPEEHVWREEAPAKAAARG
jgi:MFS family permease